MIFTDLKGKSLAEKSMLMARKWREMSDEQNKKSKSMATNSLDDEDERRKSYLLKKEGSLFCELLSVIKAMYVIIIEYM